MLAQAGVGNGPIWTSTQLGTLEVAMPHLSMAIETAALEQGKTVEVVAKINQQIPFEGEAVVKLVGLPVTQPQRKPRSPKTQRKWCSR